MRNKLTTVVIIFVAFSASVFSQTTEFTYQGSLKNGSAPANGNYDFEFRLYDAPSGGSQIGLLVTRTNVEVADGLFSVKLDFTGGITPPFPGGYRYLDISVQPAGGGGYTALTPRQSVTSAPYSIKSATADSATNAMQLGGVAANQFVQTGDSRLSDARPPTAGSANYVQNTSSLQAASNFNVSGTGTANIINATSQYNFGGNRVLLVVGSGIGPFANTFLGVGAGAANPSGLANTFVGNDAGAANGFGEGNSFFGYRAGAANVSGFNNAIFGSNAGAELTTGYNSIFGNGAGGSTSSGDSNSFFGSGTAANNTIGSDNSFFGRNAGNTNLQGNNLTLIGRSSNVAVDGLSFATAIGASAVVSSSNTIALGRSNGTDKVVIYGLGSAGSTTLCRNASNQISTCSSSLRYKTNIGGFSYGLSLVNQFKPITFDWKDGGMHDLGLGAEDVAAIEPLLVNYNDKGQVEGVKYDRIGVVLINAVKEQQAQIESQQAQIDSQQGQIEVQQSQIDAQSKDIDGQKAIIAKQQAEIDMLKAFVCSQNPAAAVCKLQN